jgi:hypothetical protein
MIHYGILSGPINEKLTESTGLGRYANIPGNEITVRSKRESKAKNRAVQGKQNMQSPNRQRCGMAFVRKTPHRFCCVQQ